MADSWPRRGAGNRIPHPAAANRGVPGAGSSRGAGPGVRDGTRPVSAAGGDPWVDSWARGVRATSTEAGGTQDGTEGGSRAAAAACPAPPRPCWRGRGGARGRGDPRAAATAPPEQPFSPDARHLLLSGYGRRSPTSCSRRLGEGTCVPAPHWVGGGRTPPHRGTPDQSRAGSWDRGRHSATPPRSGSGPDGCDIVPTIAGVIREALGSEGGAVLSPPPPPPPHSGNQRAHDSITVHYVGPAGGPCLRQARCSPSLLIGILASAAEKGRRRGGGARALRQAAVTVINLPSARTTALGLGAVHPHAGTVEEWA